MRDGTVRAFESKEKLPLVEHGGLRRVQIFRRPVPEHAPAKPDDAPALVRDRDHHTIAKSVVDAAAALACGAKPRLKEQFFRDAALLKGVGEL